MHKFCLLVVMACVGGAFARDCLSLVIPVRTGAVPLCFEPCRPAPDVKAAVATAQGPRVTAVNFMNPQAVIERELQSWGVGSICRWLSVGAMALPSFTVSRVSWVPNAVRKQKGGEEK